ncbi:MAG TPA: hypothetical protein VN238_17970 [Solirubrobacteraceae bacterium]|nr:hypothetical protein [Solirubrobacteraceae bacterium]
MRKTISTLSALGAIGATALVTAGCGTDDVDPAAIAQAAERTRAADSADVRVGVETKGFGFPGRLRLKGEGVTSLTEPELALTLDLGPLLALTGQGDGDGTTRLRVDGKDVAVDLPELRGFDLPDGATWLGLDLERTIDAMGIDATGLGEILTLDPGAQLDVLRTADDVEGVGTETVGGAETTHYRGTIRIADFIAKLPAERRAAARKALGALEAETDTADDATAFDVWIDGDDRIRRTVQRAAVPGQQGVPGGELKITLDLSGFGAARKPAAPPRADTYDVTGDVTRALRAQR